MKKKLDIAKWEFLEKVRSKAFLISLILMPVLMVGFAILPGLLASKPDTRIYTLGVIDETRELLPTFSKKLEEKYRIENDLPNYVIRNLWIGGDLNAVRQEAVQLVAKGEIYGFLYIPSDVMLNGKVEYRAENVSNFRIAERLSRTLEETLTEKKLIAAGFDASLIKELRTRIDLRSLKITEGGEEKESGFLQTFFGAYIFIMMLLFMVLSSGQLLIRSVVEEKTNRVMEVLLSSCSANDLMVGKILGLSALGLFQVAIWSLIGIALSLQLGTNIVAVEYLWLLAVYFVLGYLLYAAIFVGAGAPVTTEQEAQQITTYVSMTLVFPIVLAVPATQNPDSILIKVLSFIPFMTPSFMLLRISVQLPPVWEIVGTLVLLAVSVVVAMWGAGKIFRVAILSYGKRPTIPEMVRMLRTR